MEISIPVGYFQVNYGPVLSQNDIQLTPIQGLYEDCVHSFTFLETYTASAQRLLNNEVFCSQPSFQQQNIFQDFAKRCLYLALNRLCGTHCVHGSQNDTPALLASLKALLREGKFTFFRDLQFCTPDGLRPAVDYFGLNVAWVRNTIRDFLSSNLTGTQDFLLDFAPLAEVCIAKQMLPRSSPLVSDAEGADLEPFSTLQGFSQLFILRALDNKDLTRTYLESIEQRLCANLNTIASEAKDPFRLSRTLVLALRFRRECARYAFQEGIQADHNLTVLQSLNKKYRSLARIPFHFTQPHDFGQTSPQEFDDFVQDMQDLLQPSKQDTSDKSVLRV